VTGSDEPTRAAPGGLDQPTFRSDRDEPTIAGSIPVGSGGVEQPGSPPRFDEPTVAEPTMSAPGGVGQPTFAAGDEPAVDEPSPGQAGGPDEPTFVPGFDEPTVSETTVSETTVADPGGSDEPTVVTAVHDPAGGEALGDEPTTAVGDESPTTTGPTVGGWPAGVGEPPPPGELVWRSETIPPEPPRSPAYYVALGAAVVLVVGLVAVAVVFSVVRPVQEVAGSARAGQVVPEISPPGSAPPPPPPTSTAPAGPLAAVAAHPLASSPARMGDVTCSLPRFDPADGGQAAFYAAAKTCADDAWRRVLQEAGLDGGVEVVTVTATTQTRTCGEVTPTSPATHCGGTVYLTPARLRDTEQNGRYPGRYLGVFLREYAGALQNTSGLAELVEGITTGSAEDLDKRLAQQATCLAGVASGAMSGRGAVDTNITGEIGDRLSRVDAPPDARAWLDKGARERTLSACNTWG
jgi:hypothetical protein